MKKRLGLFTVKYGSERREKHIRDREQEDITIAVICAAVHFEWTIKRFILKLGKSSTKAIRSRLEGIYGKEQYEKIWKDEVLAKYSSLYTIIDKKQLKGAFDVRGRIVHGNGLGNPKKAHEAVESFLSASGKLRNFAEKHGENLDTRLKTRRI